MEYQFEDRLTHLRDRIRDVDSRLVEVRRDGNLLFTARASVRELRVEELLDYGVTLDVRRVDFIFTRSEVPINYIPEVTDTIHVEEDALDCQVTPMGEATWRWTTSRRHAMRVHTSASAYTIGDLAQTTIYVGSTIGDVVVTTDVTQLAPIYTGAMTQYPAVQADLDNIYTGSILGEIEPSDDEDVVPV